jgi:hypothetical protein
LSFRGERARALRPHTVCTVYWVWPCARAPTAGAFRIPAMSSSVGVAAETNLLCAISYRGWVPMLNVNQRCG